MSSIRRQSNFSQLKAHDEQLERLGLLAERYFADDPNTCLLKLRQLTEGMAQSVASRVAKIDKLEAQRVALAEKLQAMAKPAARDLKKWDEKSLRSFVERYKSEIEFGDAETKKAVLRTLVASAKLDDDDLSLVPNYPVLTGVNVASPRRSPQIPALRIVRSMLLVA